MDVLIKYLLLACFGYVFLRLLIPYVGFFARYMFNETLGFDKYVERPRLVFYGIGLVLMRTSYSSFLEYAKDPSSFFFIGNCLIFLGGIAMSQIIWSKRFKIVFIPRIKEQLKRKNNFNISCTNAQLCSFVANVRISD